jgi:2,4-dienoyl-CoA reductase-like NADH-dependent reductase (Old Yellow Enzyme family)
MGRPGVLQRLPVFAVLPENKNIQFMLRCRMSKDILFSPFHIKNYRLKNRIGVAPMTRRSSIKDSVPRQDVLDFLVRRAENGAALVYTEAIVTDYESAQGYPGQARILTQRQIDAWRPVVKAIQDKGAIAIMQMFHCGRMAWQEVNPAKRVIAASPIPGKQSNPLTGKPYPAPDEMTQFDIDHVINGFVETAKGAVQAGFDGIEIHGAHGYLINNFLSAYSNQRSDEYGGTVENRFRFSYEVIQAVHNVVPEDRLLTFRISNWGAPDMEVSLFKDKDEWQGMIKLLSKAPIDAISVSTYRYKDKAWGTDRNMAQLTREVTDLPIMICGQIYDRTSAEDALADADIVLSGKSMLLNPDWVEDVRSGKELPLYRSEEANVAYTDTPLP